MPAPGTRAGLHNKLAIVNLVNGTTTVREDVQAYQLNKSGTHVALQRYGVAGRTARGADLVLHNFTLGSDITLGNIAEYAWSDDGSMLAMTIDVDGKTGIGVQLLHINNGTLQSLDASGLQYLNLQWRPRSTDLVAFRSRADSAFADTAYSVMVWRATDTATPTEQVYDASSDALFPAGMRVVSYRRAQWADNGSTLFFGIAPRAANPTPVNNLGPIPARVEVWHWKDLRQYHQQDRQSATDRTRNSLVAWQTGSTHCSPQR